MGISAKRQVMAGGGRPSFDNRMTALVGLIAFATSLLGIAFRMDEAAASFWPANAVLLGMFIRWRYTAGLLSWPAALAGMVLAAQFTKRLAFPIFTIRSAEQNFPTGW